MISQDYFWYNVIVLAIGTISIRLSIILISTRIKITDRVREYFSFIPAAILPAFIAPVAFYHQGSVSYLFGKERFVIMIFATVVCFFSKSTLATIVSGLVALYLLTQVF
jgi:branched-subunit amino acid transport protein